MDRRKDVHSPSRLLEHFAGPVGDLLVHASCLLGVDLAPAELLLDGIEACGELSMGCTGRWEVGEVSYTPLSP